MRTDGCWEYGANQLSQWIDGNNRLLHRKRKVRRVLFTYNYIAHSVRNDNARILWPFFFCSYVYDESLQGWIEEKWKPWLGGGGGGDFGKRAFSQLSCTLIISRSELNPDLTLIRLYFSNFRCRSDKRCGWPWWVFGRLRWVGRRRVFGWIRRRLERWFAEKAGVGSKNERKRRGWRSRSWISWWFWRWLGRRGEILQLII